MNHDICPGCGRWVLSEEPWEAKGTMHFTDEERAKYEAEEALYKQNHGDCHAHRWSMQDSLTMHCGKCCPPPPLFAHLNRPGQGDAMDDIKTNFRRLFQ